MAASSCLLVCVVIFSSKITRKQGCARHRQTSERGGHARASLHPAVCLLHCVDAEPLENRGFLHAVINTAALALLPGPCCRWQTENEI